MNDDEVMHALVEQLRVSETRLREQVVELRRVADVHRDLQVALRQHGQPAFAALLEAAEASVRLAAAEVEHGLAAWRRAVHRSISDTQPIRIDVSLG